MSRAEPPRGGPRPESGTMGYRRCLVIGGAGLLGFELVRRLAQAGKRVRVLDLRPLPEPVGEMVLGDIRDRDVVRRAAEGVEVVFQAAAAARDARTPARAYEEVNVAGNRLVVETCREMGIRRLVYTSTLDVVADGRRPVADGDESLPYPPRLPRDACRRTRILAERLVLAANGPELATCALRPVGMYGPRDRGRLGLLVRLARRGLYVRLGDGSARFSHAYSENVAHAHCLAAQHLWPGSKVAGRCYFIGDHYPAGNLFDFLEPYLKALGLPPARRSIPYPLAYALAFLAEIVAPRSPFDRLAVVQACVDRTFMHHRAMRDFGYRPIVSREEAFRRTLRWLREQEWAVPAGAADEEPPAERGGEGSPAGGVRAESACVPGGRAGAR